jgi:3'-phosphoadenosine 5'-phosphosulfate sulfotransferase (PAPS reductase)/FAD synthetase
MSQLLLSGLEIQSSAVQPFQIATSPTVDALLQQHAPVALGVSGGKDSSAMSLAVSSYLDEIGHRGPRLLIHSDLGRVEWRESLPWCQKLAARLGVELVIVRRQAGDLLDRWQVRWRNNVARYAKNVFQQHQHRSSGLSLRAGG